MSYSITREYEQIVDAYQNSGGDKNDLLGAETARLVIHQNKVLDSGSVKGLVIQSKETANGVDIHLTVEQNTKITKPVHLCFGMLPKEGLQEIIMKVDAGDNSEITVVSHCIFPNAVKIIHRMDAVINVGNHARYEYQETHYHGEYGGVEVVPKGRIFIGKGGIYQSSMVISQGCVGKLDYDFEVFCGEEAVTELVVKAYGKQSDDIKVHEIVHLDGASSRGMAKSRIVLKDKARAEVRGETYGNAPEARGHVDCIELVNGTHAIATAIPIVSVTNDRAKVTHEAAIGSIDKKQVETLMARGLNEEESIDIIVKGILK